MARLRRTSTVEAGVTVIGLGNWGSSLAAALEKSAAPLREWVHARPASPTGREARLRGAIRLEDATLDARILWLCVPDGAIAATTARVARQRSRLRGQMVLHSSGALTRDVLRAARDAGASVASVHPLMTFPTPHPVPLAGVPFGVEAEEKPLRQALFRLVRQLGGKPFAVPSEGKALYHAAGMFASPLLTSLLAGAAACLRAAGIEDEGAEALLGPLAAATLANVAGRGLSKSLSGPWARGDVATVKLHLHALQPHPLLAEVYRSLAVLALESLSTHDTQALLRLLTAETPDVPQTALRPGPKVGGAGVRGAGIRREGD